MPIMERNYRPLEKNGKWYVQYEYYDHITDRWIKTTFTGMDREDIWFYTKEHCENWIEAREAIISI